MKLTDLTLGVGLTGIRLGKKTKQRGVLASTPQSIDFTEEALNAVYSLIYYTGKDKKELTNTYEYNNGKMKKFTLRLEIEELSKKEIKELKEKQ